MKKDILKWLCDKAGIKYCLDEKGKFSHTVGINNLEIYIKAIWAINRERKYCIIMDTFAIEVQTEDYDKEFPYSNFNNSEQEALAAALEYICKNKG